MSTDLGGASRGAEPQIRTPCSGQRRPDAEQSVSVVDAAAELARMDLPPAVRTAVDE
ncbi:hypothetical protein [Halogeometricum pallidum]|uniref:hypothetical protein n=1 Tax=Halogeometricum pallidum TaxID=411361 RepID=UPI001360B616|nr:hypothetical protein [Halogeometricum pallidum]